MVWPALWRKEHFIDYSLSLVDHPTRSLDIDDEEPQEDSVVPLHADKFGLHIHDHLSVLHREIRHGVA